MSLYCFCACLVAEKVEENKGSEIVTLMVFQFGLHKNESPTEPEIFYGVGGWRFKFSWLPKDGNSRGFISLT